MLVGPLAGAILTLVLGASSALGATITVTTAVDELNAGGESSLREAVRSANLNQAVGGCTAGSGSDEIVFASAVAAGPFTLTLGPDGDDLGVRGDLDLSGTLIISGSGSTVIEGGPGPGQALDRVFEILAGANITLRDL